MRQDLLQIIQLCFIGQDTLSKTRILLAEDDEISQEIVKQVLSVIDDVEVTVVIDGREALLACMARKFDLLIVDRNMPLISGDRLIRQIRASKNLNSDTPIMLCSANTAEELREMGVSCPADLHVSKPINLGQFLASAKALIA